MNLANTSGQTADEKAKSFSEMVRTYQERLYWHIRKMVLVHDDANDVLQNTFMKAWKGLDNFRGDSQISTWLYRIATNETLSFLSQKKARMMNSFEDVEDSTKPVIREHKYFLDTGAAWRGPLTVMDLLSGEYWQA